MDTERFKKIEKIFHAALELPVGRRQAFVAEACAGDAAVRREVKSLIALDEGDEDVLLESTPQRLVAELIDEEDLQQIKVGDTVGHFEIIELLGKGGMGEVYLARDAKLGRNVALKFMPPEFVANADRLRRFIREARTASALNHPNIITIYDINEVAGRHFISNEYIDGQTLRQLVNGRPVEPVRALDIAIQIASALSEAHAAGIVHRDIKPDNIMVRRNGLVKILDFGIAKVADGADADAAGTLEHDASATGTRAGVLVGTAEYMSPEQARGLGVDTRTDLFSFGIVLFEMLSGRPPFDGATPLETIESVLHNEPPAVGLESPEIITTIDRCLRKDRDERYQSADELLIDLRAARRAVDHRRSRPTTEVDTRPARPDEARVTGGELRAPYVGAGARRRVAFGKWIAFALVLVGGAGFFGYRFADQNRQISSIAVMPFANEGNRDIDYLSDGMTEALISNLSNVPNLSIKARDLVFRYKGKNLDPGQVGRELSVDAVLLGRLTQVGDDLKLRLELVDAVAQDVIWTESYDRHIDDLAAFQVEIAGDVSKKLRNRLTQAQQDHVAKVYTANSEAHQLYLKGRFHWNKRNIRDLQRAAGYFELAVEKDPGYALAHAGLADTLALMPLYGNYRPKEYMPRAKQAAERALELDDALAEAHASLGYILNCFDYDWKGAEREYRRAVSLNPSYATARQWYAEHLAFRGKTDEALEQISKALELDPLSLVINRMKGNILIFGNRHDDAIAQFERTIEMYPDNALVRFNLGDAYVSKGLKAEAVESYLTALQIDGLDTAELGRLRTANATAGWDGFWREYLSQQIAVRNSAYRNGSAYFDDEGIAFAYAATGNREKTIEYLERAYEERSSALITIGRSEVYEFLKKDPRFVNLLQNIGLPR
jgi:serine/threonine-protein kinase